MYWSEDSGKKEEFIIPDNIVDVVFSVKGKSIPLDNAHSLALAIEKVLPWVANDNLVGIHQVFGAESGNGWQRPENTDNEILHLSKRQKLTIRVPNERIQDIQDLSGQTLDLDGYALGVGKSTVRKLSDMNIVFARHVVVDEAGQSEDAFMRASMEQLQQLGIQVKKMMCGRERYIQLPDKKLITRGLMIADLEKMESIRLQEKGIGIGRKLGCGLFLPQKGIDAVNPD